MQNRIRAVIIQLASWGDVVISTCLVHAARTQRPEWRIDYITSSACASAVTNNPDIDNLVIIPASKQMAWDIQDQVIAEARSQYDIVIAPWAGFRPVADWVPASGNERTNFMWAYCRAAEEMGLTVPRPLTIWLYPDSAAQICARQLLRAVRRDRPKEKLVLMEVSGESCQTAWSDQWTDAVLRMMWEHFDGKVVFLISQGGPESEFLAGLRSGYPPGSVIRLNELSLPAVSVLFNDCDLFLSVSSGTSNACHGHQCRRDMPWCESVVSNIWDSSPLRSIGKHIYCGHDLQAYLTMLKIGLEETARTYV